jgi:hypothetical protein
MRLNIILSCELKAEQAAEKELLPQIVAAGWHRRGFLVAACLPFFSIFTATSQQFNDI